MKKIFSILTLLIAVPFAGFGQYCIPADTGTTDVMITSIDDGSYSSLIPIDGTGYEDHSSTIMQTVLSGTSMYVGVKANQTAYMVNIFVDFNGDGDFDDSGEWSQQNESGYYFQLLEIYYTATINIPSNVKLGISRMRVIVSAPDSAITSACGDMKGGHVVDCGIKFVKEFRWYRDSDHDGQGDLNKSKVTSTNQRPNGYVSDSTDCDDNNNLIYPGAVPLNLSVSNPTSSTAIATWDEGCATKWRTRRSILGQNDWVYALPSSNSRKLVNLEPGTEYEVQVRAFDADSSDWSSSQYFTTLSTCINATDLSVGKITSTSADLRWTTGTDGVTKRVRYREVGTEEWTGKNVGKNNVHRVFTGLQESTTYEWQIKTMCSGTDVTAWSESHQFTTSAPAARMEFIAGEGISAFSVYPNPGAGLFTVTADFDNAETVNIAVTDILGRAIYSTPQSVTAGENSFTVNLTNQAAGIYFLKITSASGMLTQKIMIQ